MRNLNLPVPHLKAIDEGDNGSTRMRWGTPFIDQRHND
ncbi:hypothetical protein A2U01_0043491 [Trifolium medium]|uniref:Uncharacterized protein n=1 Tax=Trifolium medium TaxID=97028 RepID=A0A392QG87_9FABA|nr:hypothetical protein [Trifolium medium]